MDILRTGERVHVTSAAIRPGDYEAMMFLRHITNSGVTPEEYRTAMPKMLQYALKEEGGQEAGFDGDFFVVAEWLIKYAENSMGEGEFAGLPKDKRIALLANVYGKMELLKQTIWRDPAQGDYKKKLIVHAEKMLKMGKSDTWNDVILQREKDRLEQSPASSQARTLRLPWREIFTRWKR